MSHFVVTHGMNACFFPLYMRFPRRARSGISKQTRPIRTYPECDRQAAKVRALHTRRGKGSLYFAAGAAFFLGVAAFFAAGFFAAGFFSCGAFDQWA